MLLTIIMLNDNGMVKVAFYFRFGVSFLTDWLVIRLEFTNGITRQIVGNMNLNGHQTSPWY